MKIKSSVVLGLGFLLLLSCSKKESNPTGPENNGSEQTNVGIFPGVGAAKMKLGETLAKLRQVHGSPNSHPYAHYSTGKTRHYLYYDSLKAVFEFFNHSSSVFETDSITSISVQAPYGGLTAKSIGIGSSLNDVKAAYGDPPQIVTGSVNYYEYASLGITFYYDQGALSSRK